MVIQEIENDDTSKDFETKINLLKASSTDQVHQLCELLNGKDVDNQLAMSAIFLREPGERLVEVNQTDEKQTENGTSEQSSSESKSREAPMKRWSNKLR